MENTDATQKICFTLAPQADGNGVNVTQIQIDSNDAIPIVTAGPLTAESAQTIAKEFTDIMSPLPSYEEATSNPDLQLLPQQTNDIIQPDNANTTNKNASNSKNVQPFIYSDIKLSDDSTKTIASVLDQIKKHNPINNKNKKTVKQAVRNFTKQINDKLESGMPITAADIKQFKENEILKGGAHKTVKNLHTRRRVKSNTRKGHVYRQNTSRRAAPRHRVTRRR